MAVGTDAPDPAADAALALAARRGCLTVAVERAGTPGTSRPRRRPLRAPGAGRDALPRALGAGARVLRPPRAARGARGRRGPRLGRRRRSSTPSWPSRSTTSRPWSRTSGRSVLMKADEVAALRAPDAGRQREGLAAAAAAMRAAPRRRRHGARAGQRRLGDRRHGCGRRPARRAPGLALAAGARPLRGPGDPHGDRQRRRRRGHLRPPGDRVRARGRRPAVALDQRQLGQCHRRPRRGAAARARRRWRWSATTAAGSRPRGSPTTSS